MPAVARKGDSIDHGGQIIQGSPNLNVNGKPCARVGDQVQCTIHGLVTITTGSPTGRKNQGKLLARVGSLCSCGAKIITGSPNVTCA